MRVKIWTQLLDKRVLIDGEMRDVYGLSDFHVRPSRRGIGKYCLQAFKELAKKDGKYCIVGFCDTESMLREFYVKNGFYYYGKYGEKYLFSSIPVRSIEVNETW